MKTLDRFPVVLITALVAMAESAYGQQPTDVVTSDPSHDTAMGASALAAMDSSLPNFVGDNTASGDSALLSDTSGSFNTASGFQALEDNSNGFNNTASGTYALQHNAGGYQNTASEYGALLSNTTGYDNDARGYEAIYSNLSGVGNTAAGFRALYFNTTHHYNTALGFQALYKTNGHRNIGVGYQAGFNSTTGTNNIDIGSTGATADSGVIRIGTQIPSPLQTNTYITGIFNNTSVSGLAVVVDSNGQLGAVASSERFKTAITPMGSNSAKLQRLRPVTFKLKSDP